MDDRGVAFERTTLAWNRTGLASVTVGALVVRVYWEGDVLGIALGSVFVVIGVLAYTAGSNPPAGPRRLRAMSLAVTLAAVLGVGLSIVG